MGSTSQRKQWFCVPVLPGVTLLISGSQKKNARGAPCWPSGQDPGLSLLRSGFDPWLGNRDPVSSVPKKKKECQTPCKLFNVPSSVGNSELAFTLKSVSPKTMSLSSNYLYQWNLLLKRIDQSLCSGVSDSISRAKGHPPRSTRHYLGFNERRRAGDRR